MTYIMITNGYDWGPAIDKIILDLETIVDSKSFNKDDFSVKVQRTYAKTQIFERKITAAYSSDAVGNQTAESRYITLELEVGPNKIEGSPFNYNASTGRNEYVQTSYEIALMPMHQLKSNTGDDLALGEGVFHECTGELNPLCDRFVQNQAFQFDDVLLTYAHFEPKSTSNTEQVTSTCKKPLIIWLHGAGEGGLDTSIPLLGNKVTNLITSDIQRFFGPLGAYILVPQAPTMWMDYNGASVYNTTVSESDGYSHYTLALKELIDTFISEHDAIDIDRIYIGGCSNGGYMTVRLLIDYPDFFAAAFPTCEVFENEWLTDARIEKIKHIPIWLIHSQDDPVIRISRFDRLSGLPLYDPNGNFIPLDTFSNALFDRMLRAGNQNCYYSRYDYVIDPTGRYNTEDGKAYVYHGHWSWIYTLNNSCTQTIDGKTVSLFEWLSNQKRNVNNPS